MDAIGLGRRMGLLLEWRTGARQAIQVGWKQMGRAKGEGLAGVPTTIGKRVASSTLLLQPSIYLLL